MTSHLPQPAPAPAHAPALDPALDPATLSALLDTLPHPPGASAEEIAARRASALETVATLNPRDLLETALAARIVAAHYAVMESFRCAAQPDLPADLKLRHQTKAATLSRLMDSTLAALLKRQAGPALRPAAQPQAASPPPPAPTKAAQAPAAAAPARAQAPRTDAPRVPLGVPASAPMTAAQQELLMRELAARAATASTALAA
jgi:hypothetical protein